MAITPPPLDARGYDDLVADALRRVPALHARVDELPPRRRRRHARRAVLVPRRVRDLPGEPRAGTQPARVRRAARRAARARAAGAGHRHADPAAVRRAGAGADRARGVRRLGAVPAHERARRAARRGARASRARRCSSRRPSSSRATSACTSSPAARTCRREADALPHGADRRRGAAHAARRHRRPLRLDRAARAGADRQDDQRRRGPARDRRPDPVGRRRRRAVDGPAAADAPAASSPAAGAPPPLAVELPRTGEVVLRDGRPHVEWTTVPAHRRARPARRPGDPPRHAARARGPAGRARRRAARGRRRRAARPTSRTPTLEARVVTWLRLRGAREQHRADGLGGRQRRDGVPARPRDRRACRHRHRAARPGGCGWPARRWSAAACACASPSPAASASGARSATCSTRRARSRSCRAPARPARRRASEPELPRPDRVFTLSPADGALRFGDGRHGRRPPAQAAIDRRLRPRARRRRQRAAGRDHVVAGAARRA